MQNQNVIKIAKLVIILIAALACSYLAAQSSRASIGQDQPRRQLEFAGVDAPFESRAGVDDGAVLAIQFMGSTHGSLEPCG